MCLTNEVCMADLYGGRWYCNIPVGMRWQLSGSLSQSSSVCHGEAHPMRAHIGENAYPEQMEITYSQRPSLVFSCRFERYSEYDWRTHQNLCKFFTIHPRTAEQRFMHYLLDHAEALIKCWELAATEVMTPLFPFYNPTLVLTNCCALGKQRDFSDVWKLPTRNILC